MANLRFVTVRIMCFKDTHLLQCKKIRGTLYIFPDNLIERNYTLYFTANIRFTCYIKVESSFSSTIQIETDLQKTALKYLNAIFAINIYFRSSTFHI